MKHGLIRHIPPRDDLFASGQLLIEILGDDNKRLGEIELSADSLVSEENQRMWSAFAFRVEEAPRRAEYLKRFPPSEGEHNRYRIEAEIRDDLDDWLLRERRGRERYAGLDPEAVRALLMHR